ncbi:MAG: aminodeoxychorismate synthase component I [Methylococcaceae bacterium]|nr:MAG: aminodeoxychorismate synthase component I [Methylococcaceae bacterium]
MTAPLLSELPYSEDSAALFTPWAERPWAVFLDSGPPHGRQGRYDILAADPYATLVTQGNDTEIRYAAGLAEDRSSSEDPFLLLKQCLGATVATQNSLPFCGGAIGYFGYDLARRLENLPTHSVNAEHIPDMIIGLYDWAVVVDHQEKRSWLVAQGRDPRSAARWPELLRAFSQVQTVAWQPHSFRVLGEVQSNLPRERYAKAFAGIQRYIREGDCYQVNLAQRFAAPCQGSPWYAYHQLRRLNCAPFSAYLNHPQVQTLCSSPERFLQVRNGVVETKPIKGTRPRGFDAASDLAQAQALRNSPKDQAENLMIVDLLRNDLGKNCQPGSVHVPTLFDVESFATVHHLVSTVRGKLADGTHALDLLRGCFPGGSITGAPKVRAMQIIEELEPHRRGIYCGAIGYVGFDGNMDTNIAIRTLVHSGSLGDSASRRLSNQTIRFWAGGGIVADSVMEEEYRECYAKASALLTLLQQSRREAESP